MAAQQRMLLCTMLGQQEPNSNALCSAVAQVQFALNALLLCAQRASLPMNPVTGKPVCLDLAL